MLNFTNVTHFTLIFAFHASLPRKFTYSSSSLAKAKATNWGFNPVRTGLPCFKEVKLRRGTSRNRRATRNYVWLVRHRTNTWIPESHSAMVCSYAQCSSRSRARLTSTWELDSRLLFIDAYSSCSRSLLLQLLSRKAEVRC